MKFIIYRDVIKEYRWRLRAANNKILADSGEGYYNKDDLKSAIQLIKRYAPTAPIVDLTIPKY